MKTPSYPEHVNERPSGASALHPIGRAQARPRHSAQEASPHCSWKSRAYTLGMSMRKTQIHQECRVPRKQH
eukprot:12446648-Alexandrium_andersonii.AAC.1